MSFSIKLQEINLYVCEEYKTEREARGPNRTELDDRISRHRRAHSCDLRSMRMCPAKR